MSQLTVSASHKTERWAVRAQQAECCLPARRPEQLVFTRTLCRGGSRGPVDSPDPPVFTKPLLEDENYDDIFGRYSFF